MYQFGLPPDANIHNLPYCVGNEVDVHILTQRDIWYFDGMVEERDTPVTIDHSLFAQAEDVVGRSVGFADGEGTKETIASSLCGFEPDSGDFSCCGVDLLVVVAIDFVFQDRADFFDGGEFFIGTGAHDAILQPAVWSFDLAFSLRRESVGNIYSQDSHHLAPLCFCLIGLEHMFAPEAVSALDEAKDPKAVHVVAQG